MPLRRHGTETEALRQSPTPSKGAGAVAEGSTDPDTPAQTVIKEVGGVNMGFCVTTY